MAQEIIEGDRYEKVVVRAVPNERLPVDIGANGTVNLNGDVIAEFDGIEEALGTPADAAAASDSATASLIALIKRLLGKQAVPRTPTTTSVASSATSVTILASNANRRGFSISNVSTSKLYLSFSTPATTTNSFIEVPAGAFLLLDQQMIVTGAIYGIWASANGTAQVTEYV